MIKWKDCDNDMCLFTIGNKYVYKEDFDRLFEGYDSYNDLIKHKNITDGWRSIFVAWKEKGILD